MRADHVVICEDLTRSADIGGVLADWGVSHVLVLVLSGTMWWTKKPAQYLAQECGASVVISNGRALRAGEDDTNVITIAGVVVAGQERKSWDLFQELWDKGEVTDVKIAEVPAGSPRSWGDFRT